MMQPTEGVGAISDDLRHKLHSSTGKQIRQLLITGEILTEQVLEAIIPLVTISNGDIGGFSRGATSRVRSDGRKVVHFLAVNSNRHARDTQNLNNDVPVLDWTHGDSISGAKDLISEYIPKTLHHSVCLHSCEPTASIANHAYIAALAASLSPVAVWSIDTSSMMHDILDTTSCFARTFNLAAAVGLPQNRERLWLSNVDMEYPKLNVPRTSMMQTLNLGPGEKSSTRTIELMIPPNLHHRLPG